MKGRTLERASEGFRFATAVAEFGLLLRESEHRGTANFGQVLQRAKLAQGTDLSRYREDFIRLVDEARLLYARSAK